jgi:hypothetical protein
MHAGNVSVSASNKGPETHELVIVRGNDAAALPTKTDGSVDEDKIPETDKVGEFTDIAAGRNASTSPSATSSTPAGLSSVHHCPVCQGEVRHL